MSDTPESHDIQGWATVAADRQMEIERLERKLTACQEKLEKRDAALAGYTLSPREVELVCGMIEVQREHANRCDRIQNRTMAEKQKGWDMERVAILEKMLRANDSLPASAKRDAEILMLAKQKDAERYQTVKQLAFDASLAEKYATDGPIPDNQDDWERELDSIIAAMKEPK